MALNTDPLKDLGFDPKQQTQEQNPDPKADEKKKKCSQCGQDERQLLTQDSGKI